MAQLNMARLYGYRDRCADTSSVGGGCVVDEFFFNGVNSEGARRAGCEWLLNGVGCRYIKLWAADGGERGQIS